VLVFGVVEARSCVRKRAAVRRGRERTVEEAVQILWRIIDEAKLYMADPLLESEEKRRWAKTLADTIGVLNKLLAGQGEKQLDDEDLASLLTKVPRTWQTKVAKRAMMWRRKSFVIDYSSTWGLQHRSRRA